MRCRLDTELELKVASELADAELGVAEELGWPIGLLVAISAHLYVHNWWLTIPAAFAAYYAATYKYRREAKKAEDRYFRFAGLGKYVGQSKGDA